MVKMVWFILFCLRMSCWVLVLRRCRICRLRIVGYSFLYLRRRVCLCIFLVLSVLVLMMVMMCFFIFCFLLVIRVRSCFGFYGNLFVRFLRFFLRCWMCWSCRMIFILIWWIGCFLMCLVWGWVFVCICGVFVLVR